MAESITDTLQRILACNEQDCDSQDGIILVLVQLAVVRDHAEEIRGLWPDDDVAHAQAILDAVGGE